MFRWNVYLKGRLIHGVFYQSNCDKEHVKTDLINRDGYDTNIVVMRVRGAYPKHV